MKVNVFKTYATIQNIEQLTSGLVGKILDIEYTEDWNGLNIVAVFSNGSVTKDVLNPGNACVIPHEVLADANRHARVGFYGYVMQDEEKVIAIPTVYADLGRVVLGADPSGDPSATPTPTVAEQLQGEIDDHEERIQELEAGGGGGGGGSDWGEIGGNINNQTDLKNALDGKANVGDIPSLSGYATEQWVTDKHYLTEHQDISGKANIADLAAVATSGSYNDLSNKPTIPSAVTESTVSGWGFTKNTGTYSKPSGGIPKTDLASDVQTSLGRADTALQSHQSLAGYARKTDLDDYVEIAQGVAHAGEFLVVGSDGNVTTMSLSAWQGGSY